MTTPTTKLPAVCTHPVYRDADPNAPCRACLREAGFCRHRVPVDAYCRWCREGGEPETRVEPTEAEREARKARIRSAWERELADMQADIYKAGRDARVGRKVARGLRGRS